MANTMLVLTFVEELMNRSLIGSENWKRMWSAGSRLQLQFSGKPFNIFQPNNFLNKFNFEFLFCWISKFFSTHFHPTFSLTDTLCSFNHGFVWLKFQKNPLHWLCFSYLSTDWLKRNLLSRAEDWCETNGARDISPRLTTCRMFLLWHVTGSL